MNTKNAFFVQCSLYFVFLVISCAAAVAQQSILFNGILDRVNAFNLNPSYQNKKALDDQLKLLTQKIQDVNANDSMEEVASKMKMFEDFKKNIELGVNYKLNSKGFSKILDSFPSKSKKESKNYYLLLKYIFTEPDTENQYHELRNKIGKALQYGPGIKVIDTFKEERKARLEEINKREFFQVTEQVLLDLYNKFYAHSNDFGKKTDLERSMIIKKYLDEKKHKYQYLILSESAETVNANSRNLSIERSSAAQKVGSQLAQRTTEGVILSDGHAVMEDYYYQVAFYPDIEKLVEDIKNIETMKNYLMGWCQDLLARGIPIEIIRDEVTRFLHYSLTPADEKACLEKRKNEVIHSSPCQINSQPFDDKKGNNLHDINNVITSGS